MSESPEQSVAFPVSPILRGCIAACLTGAAVVHFAMVPSHMSEWSVEGVAFVVSGWVQVALAIAIVVRPRRWVLEMTAASSALFIGAWAITRTAGLPFGPNSGVVESVTYIDLVAKTLEGAAILLCGVAWFRPRLGERWNAERLVFASILPIAALVLATSAVTSSSASHHAHASHESASGAAAGADCVAVSDGHTHCTDVTATPVDDKGLSALSNGHHHEIVWHDLDPATQAELDRQLALTRQAAARFPTVADAEAAGYKRAGMYGPGTGAHYLAPPGAGLAGVTVDGSMSDEALLNPGTLIYDGTDPESKVAGLMYSASSTIEPVGFVGTNDVWHDHVGLCIKIAPEGISTMLSDEQDPVVKEQQCGVRGGQFVKQTGWMVHVWTVPGFDTVPGGPFAEANPALACSDNTYYTVTGSEAAQAAGHPANACQSGAPGRPEA